MGGVQEERQALSRIYAVLVGGSNGDGAWPGLVAIVELIDPRPYMFQSAVYGRLIYTRIHMRDRPLTQAHRNPRLPSPPDLRRCEAHTVAHDTINSRFKSGAA